MTVGPDLTVIGMSYQPPPGKGVCDGAGLGLAFLVKNNGNAPSPDGVEVLVNNRDTVLLPAIAVNATHGGWSRESAGFSEIPVQIDPRARMVELDRSNNTSTRSVPIPTPPLCPRTTATPQASSAAGDAGSKPPHPLSVEVMRRGDYPGSDITIEQTLPKGPNYTQAIVSYRSEGLKIRALLTIPDGPKPATGWPVIVFNHGYIPPAVYRTTGQYSGYTPAFSSRGYIVLKPDYRGHDQSEGDAGGGYGSTGYTVDVINAVRSIKRHKDADPNRIGMWGHSMGGALTLRAMVTVDDIKAGVIWAGVVAPYGDLITKWVPPSIAQLPPAARAWREGLIREWGSPAENPAFWASISPNSHIERVAPIQIHHASGDATVPIAFSDTLAAQLKAAGRAHEYHTYRGDDHNISANFGVAMQRSVAWFDKHLK